MKEKKKSRLISLFILTRPPFHSVGVFPFILGALMAYEATGTASWPVWGLGTLAVIFIMLSTYLSGEYFDYEGDCISQKKNPNPFAGGSGIMPAGIIARRVPLIGSFIALGMAAIIGSYIQFGYQTGAWTIPLGLIGIVGGFFYSTPPLRWVATGFGELWIALCYGWLPIAAAYYLHTGRIDAASMVHWVSLPVAATIFNVILLNEFPDYEADKAVNKRNMLVRLGLKNGAYLFAFVHLLGWSGVICSILAGITPKILIFYIPVFLLSFALVIAVLRGVYHNPKKLQVVCGLNILVNLCTTLSYTAIFFWRL